MPTTDKLKTRDSDNHPPRHYPFWFGGSASCFAAVVTHPLDLSMPKATHDTYGAGKYSTSICSSVLMCLYSQGRILSLPSMALICSPFRSQISAHSLAARSDYKLERLMAQRAWRVLSFIYYVLMACVDSTMVFVSLNSGLMFHDAVLNLQSRLNPLVSVIGLPPSAIDVLYHSLRRLWRTQIPHFPPSHDEFPPFPNWTCLRCGLFRWRCWQSCRCSQCSHAARCRTARCSKTELQTRHRWSTANYTGRRMAGAVPRSLAEQFPRGAHDRQSACKLRRFQIASHPQSAHGRRSKRTFHRERGSRVRSYDGVQSGRCAQDAAHERPAKRRGLGASERRMAPRRIHVGV